LKAFLPPCALLLAILLASIVNCRAMITCTERWSQQLEASDEAAAKDNWDRAEELLQKSYQDWSSYQSYLHIVARHEAVDGAEAMYRRAYAFAEEQEESEFRAELADLRHQVHLLAEMERFSIKNVL